MMRRKHRATLYQGGAIPFSLVLGPDANGTVCVVTGGTVDVRAERSTVNDGGRAREIGAMIVVQDDGGAGRMPAAVHYRDRDGRPWRSANASTEPQDVLDQHIDIRERRD